jgi:tRNA threonylcarbamoyladenosine biosynthesis protein TsaE
VSEEIEAASTSHRRHCFPSRGPDETRALARGLARAIRAEARERGLLVSLCGQLGAGKTVFAKGLAEGLGMDPEQVSSPTFVIANRYAAADGRALHHVDFYRLEDEQELEGIGFFDMLAPGELVAVEWGDRFEGALPADRLKVSIASTAGSPEGREIVVVATGPVSDAVRASWCGAPSEPEAS